MYIYIVRRTQIYLSDQEHEALDRLSAESGKTKSQLVREAVERVYLEPRGGDALVAALAASHGAWRRRNSGSDYVERLRAGRLAAMHARDED